MDFSPDGPRSTQTEVRGVCRPPALSCFLTLPTVSPPSTTAEALEEKPELPEAQNELKSVFLLRDLETPRFYGAPPRPPRPSS